MITPSFLFGVAALLHALTGLLRVSIHAAARWRRAHGKGSPGDTLTVTPWPPDDL